MYVIKRSKLVIISALVLTVITFFICIGSFSVKPIENDGINQLTIVLDAGHGGIDGGVSGVNTGVKESELNLKVVKKLENYLLSGGFNVVLTRSSDAGLYGVATSNLKRKDMLKRKEIIEKALPDLVISIHMNKYSLSTRRGAQVFYKNNDEKGKALANNIQREFNEMKEASRQCSILTGDYYILNCTEYPSVIAECGFLSNPEDEALLITEEYQDSLAYTLFRGIIGYLSDSAINFIK